MSSPCIYEILSPSIFPKFRFQTRRIHPSVHVLRRFSQLATLNLHPPPSVLNEDFVMSITRGHQAHYPIFCSIKPQHFVAGCSFVSYSTSSPPGAALYNVNISNEVLAVINSYRPFEPELNKLFPFLKREVVISVLQSQALLNKDPRNCFRFFIWAAERAQFRSGVSHNLLVDMLLSCENESSFDLYWSVLDELKAENLPVYADAFVVLILGYWRLKKADKAMETFGKMKDYDCKPNLAAYNVILNVLVKKHVILMALAVYNLMLKSNCKMGNDTYGVLIDGLCKSRMVDDALKLFDEMTLKGIKPNTITYTVILSGFCRAKRMNDALRVFNMMKSSGCTPDSATYNVLLDGFCKFGRINEALTHLKSFINDGYNIGIQGFSSLIEGFIKVKRISEAEEWFQKFFEVGLVPDVVLYSIMMRGLVEAGRREDAVNMLRDMIGKGITPDTQCYNVLIRGFCEAGILDQARSLRLEISNHDQFPNTYTYTILICGMCRHGLIEEAQQLFSDMEKHGCSPSVVTFNALIDGLCKANKLEEAHLMLYKMEIGKNPSVFLRLSQGENRILDEASLQKMVENFVESGLFFKAYKLLTQLADSGVMPDIKTYNTLINGMCKAGQVNGAFKLFEELQLKSLFPDSVTYATLIEGLQRVDREEEAFKLFEKMNENGCKPSSSVYKTLMTWSCRRNKNHIAANIWLKYLRSISGREVEPLRLIEAYFGKGEFEKAIKALLEMEIKLADFDSAPYNIWLVGLCQANRVDEALSTFNILEEFGVIVSAPSCVKLIVALCYVGKLNEATEVFDYTTKKGYRLMPRICNNLLQVLLSSKETAILAFEIIHKMKSSGIG